MVQKQQTKTVKIAVVFFLLVAGGFAVDNATQTAPQCSDGIDNDLDTYVDGGTPADSTGECRNVAGHFCPMWIDEGYNPTEAESDYVAGTLPTGVIWLGYAAYGC